MNLQTREHSLTEREAAFLSAARAVLVLGMHRGGTSAVAGLLRLSGFDLGPSLMEPVPGVNDKGFWEHVDAHTVHERLLASLGRSRFDPREMPTGWREHPAFDIAVEEVRQLIQRDFRDAPYWAIKDPRMCRLAPVWLEAFASLGIEPRVILIVRHPAEVACSMHAQRWIASSARAHLCWLQHMLEAEQATRGVARTLLTYDALLADWRAERERIGRELAFEWPSQVFDEASAIDAFVDEHERHFDGADAEKDDVPALATELFDACRSGADVWRRFAEIGATFHRGAAAFAPCLDEAIVEASLAFIEAGQGRTEATARLATNVDIAAAVNGSLDARLAPLDESAAATTLRLELIETNLSTIAQRVEEHAARAATQASTDAIAAELHATFARTEALAEHCAALSDAIGALRAQSLALERRLEANDAAARDLLREHVDALRVLRVNLETASADISELRAQHNARLSFARLFRRDG